jgi:hypothetical protein
VATVQDNQLLRLKCAAVQSDISAAASVSTSSTIISRGAGLILSAYPNVSCARNSSRPYFARILPLTEAGSGRYDWQSSHLKSAGIALLLGALRFTNFPHTLQRKSKFREPSSFEKTVERRKVVRASPRFGLHHLFV